jgi:hypothetical protein
LGAGEKIGKVMRKTKKSEILTEKLLSGQRIVCIQL